MRTEYVVNDFIEPRKDVRPAVACERKISLLYDLCILHTRFNKYGKRLIKDVREAPLRDILLKCNTELEIDNAVHDIVCGNKSLNAFLAQHGYMVG